jgi:monovalent cation:proton antiporter-2 (CPA2) family protein
MRVTLLLDAIVYLLAAIVAVPVARRLGFGSVLGYLAAGIAIGPFGLGLVGDAEHILHFAELGVVFLLFVIGLELQPSRLWVLRRMMFGLGGSQVLLTAALLAGLASLAGLSPAASVLIGLILAPSSTPFVLQLLAEKKQLTSGYGRGAFSILLMQDLFVIPLIAVIPLFGDGNAGEPAFAIEDLLITAGAIASLVVGGRYLLRPVLRIVARTNTPEIFTATALLVVIGSALLMEMANTSMVLGAFIAGVLLADSEYRHQLEADLAPFKGLLLGLFFIAVGMTVNLRLLFQDTATILAITAALMLAKAVILLPLARLFDIRSNHGPLRLAVVLSQGGEFAFVLFSLALGEGILDPAVVDRLVLAVAVSMLMTPIVYVASEALIRRKAVAEPVYDTIQDDNNAVVIAGFGRVGQIAGRLLRIAGIPFTALEIDSSQVDVVRRYGNKVYFGDASKLELLRAAGVANAKIFVLAIDDMEASLRTAETVLRNFPDVTIVARARNRRHEHHLMDLGIHHIYRETLLSSLALSEQVLLKLDFGAEDVQHLIQTFRSRDERLLREQHALRHDEERLIQSSRDTARELEMLMRNDLKRRS